MGRQVVIESHLRKKVLFRSGSKLGLVSPVPPALPGCTDLSSHQPPTLALRMLSGIILHNAKEQVSESSAAGADAGQQVHWGEIYAKVAFVSSYAISYFHVVSCFLP